MPRHPRAAVDAIASDDALAQLRWEQRPSPWPDVARALRTAWPFARELPPDRRRTLGQHAGTADQALDLDAGAAPSMPADSRQARPPALRAQQTLEHNGPRHGLTSPARSARPGPSRGGSRPAGVARSADTRA